MTPEQFVQTYMVSVNFADGQHRSAEYSGAEILDWAGAARRPLPVNPSLKTCLEAISQEAGYISIRAQKIRSRS